MLRFNNNKSVVGTALLTVCLFSASVIASQPSVEKRLLEDYPGARIQEIESVEVDGQKAYEIEFKYEGDEYEAVYQADGQLLSIQQQDFSVSIFMLGLMVQYERAIYKGQDNEVDPLPFIFYDNGDFFVRGKEAGYRFYKGWATVSAYLEVDLGAGYETDDSDFLKDMEDLDTPVNIGIHVEKELDPIELEFVLKRDVADAGDGLSAILEVGKEFELNDWLELETAASVAYHDSSYNDYFYGVDQKFAREDRPAYDADAGFDYGLEVGLRGEFKQNWHALMQVEYTWLSSEASDSPIVSEDAEFEVFFGVAYEF